VEVLGRAGGFSDPVERVLDALRPLDRRMRGRGALGPGHEK
jgi:hypothetical protein